MQQSLAAGGDMEELHRGAHSLKSSAANVGAMEVSAVAARLEATSGARDAEASAPLFGELSRAFEAAEAELRRVLEDVES
jgi:HPt (histidine-containing phosphotransfer) domain-containing protein